MFEDYRTLVRRYYEYKRANNTLLAPLIEPTPAGVRNLCFELFNKGAYDKKKDEIALTGFFGQHSDKSAMARSIKKYESTKFKPLIKFLNRETEEPDKKHIELLAWLIEFEPRPFEYGKKYEVETNTEPQIIEVNSLNIDNAEIPKKDTTSISSPILSDAKDADVTKENKSTTDSNNNTLLKKILLYTVIATFIFFGLYLYNYNKNSDSPMAMGGIRDSLQACMYWAGDHYEQVSCNREINNALVIALDSFKLQHFKKITQPDTITQQHVGRVWYIKTGGGIEFYTAEGMHPVDLQKRLKPVTAYIIDKYILSRTD